MKNYLNLQFKKKFTFLMKLFRHINSENEIIFNITFLF